MAIATDYPLFYIAGSRYTVADNSYAGMTDEVIGSLEQVQIVLSNLQGEEAELAGTLDYRTEYQIRAVECWYCAGQATLDGSRRPFQFCLSCAAEYDAGQAL